MAATTSTVSQLLSNSNVPLAPSASTTQTMTPDWYSDYAKQILANQQAQSATPYQTYQGPRVAGFTPQQLQGFNMVGQAAGSYQPGLTAATEATQGALGTSVAGAAQPYMTAAGQNAYSTVGQYMNPYTEQVVNRIGQMGARTLFENILPGISDRMIGAGQFGGTRQAELTGRGIRDAMEGISAAQMAALQSGYGQSMTAAQTDLARQGTLAGIAGQQAGTDVSNQLAGGAQLADLAARQQALGLTGAGALQTAGETQRQLGQQNLDVAYQDFLKQKGYNQEQINAALATLQGTAGAVPKAVTQTGYGPASTTTPAQPTGVQNLASIGSTLASIADIFKK